MSIELMRAARPSPERRVEGQPSDSQLVLIVDDNQMIRDLLCNAFAEDGFEVREAADGREALDQAAQRRPDAIVMDLIMPVLDGIETAKILRESAELSSVPLLAFSCIPLQGDSVRGLFSQILCKPLLPATVIDCVRGMLVRLAEGEAIRGSNPKQPGRLC
jgi:DNA-binding response OmpR family regulator